MAEQQDSGQERTEQATPKRQREAREQGQIARSRELGTTVVLMIAAAGLLLLGPMIGKDLLDELRIGLSPTREMIHDPMWMTRTLGEMAWRGFLAILPLIGLLILAAVLGPLLMGGIGFSWKALAPKYERISLLKGLKRMFAMRALIELFKSILKFLLVGSVAALVIGLELDELLRLGLADPRGGLFAALETLGWGLLLMSAATLLIAAIDVPYQLWEHVKQLRMTKQEIRDEYKETEGKPEVKQKIRQMQMQAAQRRMMQEVPRADVIITNPTHFAMALRYDSERGDAPIVVAKGRDLIAARIREIGQENGVLIFSAPPLARALYQTTDLNQPIPSELYRAVAQVLAYVYQLRQARAQGATAPPRPQVDVPEGPWTPGVS
ncbi:MAG: flagellar biosynthesis protein FlhB [Halothiobacillaceae bacterium]|nr:MAG: flagellar biosynthesis protein FlhB [Halothiobacillaceae bacterium]